MSLYGILFLVWIGCSINVIKDYINYTALYASTKGGTIVYAITKPISYMPYIGGDKPENDLYQHFLFRGCLDRYTFDDEKTPLCNIIDHGSNTYTISINTGNTRSDGTPITNDDLYFTYHDILQTNTLGLDVSTLETVSIVYTGGMSGLQMTLPTNTMIAKYLFHAPIMPMHILSGVDLEYYKTNFAANPIGSTCMRLISQNNDSSSIIFDTSRCDRMHASYIQLKYIDMQSLISRVQDPDATKNITLYTNDIDPGSGQYTTSWMDSQYLLTAIYNNRSPRINPRVKNILSSNLIQKDVDTRNMGITPYTGFLSYTVSTKKRPADSLSTSITTKADGSYDTQSMQDAGVKKLPTGVPITHLGQKHSYIYTLTSGQRDPFVVNISFPAPMVGITVKNRTTGIPFVYQIHDEGKWISVTLPVTQKVLPIGLNHLSIQATIVGQKNPEVIGGIDLYIINETTTAATKKTDKLLQLIYLDTPQTHYIYTYITQRLETLHWTGVMQIKGYPSIQEFEQAIVDNIYDIVILPINRSNGTLTAGLLSMLSSDDPVVNPSNRSHPDLTAILGSLVQPKDNTNASARESLNMRLRTMYDSVIPFAFLGSIYTPVYLSTSVVSHTNSGSAVDTSSLYSLLTDSVLVDNYHIDTKKIFSYANLTTYLQANR